MGVREDFSDAFENLYSQYDIAYGDVLITGLGFGILLKALSQKESVTSITVIEKEKDVIDAFLAHNRISKKVKIINDDATTYITNKHYDCVLPDHYELQTTAWKLNDMKNLAKRISHDKFWPWSIEYLFFTTVYSSSEIHNESNDFFKNNAGEFYEKWKKFVIQYLDGNKSMMEIKEEKLLEYLLLYKRTLLMNEES